jgi:hypothetical protein
MSLCRKIERTNEEFRFDIINNLFGFDKKYFLIKFMFDRRKFIKQNQIKEIDVVDLMNYRNLHQESNNESDTQYNFLIN